MIIQLLVILIIAAALYYIVSLIPMPQPAKNIVLAVLALILLLVALNRFGIALP